MTTIKKRILEDILPLQIIREVEKWPVLYERDSPEVPNTHFKNKVWCEVAKDLFEDWETYSQAEKECKVSDLRKKWRNLRDMFIRQVLVDRKVREGHNIKIKKYVYYQQMAFLLPHLKDSESEPAEPAHAPRRRAARAPLARPDVEHIDEDRHFLLSLLPSLQRMSDDDKLTAKMEILKVIKDVRNSSADCFVSAGAGAEPLAAVKQELLPDFKTFNDGCGYSDDSE